MTELSTTWTEKLLEVTSAFSRARTAREIGDVAVHVGMKALGASAGWLALTTRDGLLLETVSARGITPLERRALARVPLSSPHPACVVAREGRPRILASSAEWAGCVGPATAAAEPAGSRAILPLSISDRTVGCLGMRLPEWTPLDSAEREFLEALAAQCAQALDRARLLDAEQQARRRLKILAEAAEAFSGPDMSLAAVLEVVTRKVVSAAGDACVLHLVSADGLWLEPRALHAATAEARASIAASLAPTRAGAAPVARVVERRETEVFAVPDAALLRQLAQELGWTWLEAQGVRSLVVAPLVQKERVLGTLTVARTRPHDPFDGEDRLLVEGLAARAASAIEKTRLYDEVVRSQRLFEGIADASPDILYLLDVRRGRNVYVSRAVERILGYTAREIAAMGDAFLERVVHPEDRPALEAENERFRVLPEGEMVDHAYRMRRADGTWRWVRSRDRVFSRTASGQPELLLGVARDVTDHVRAERERDDLLVREQQARRDAETASRAKDEFLAMLGHELRNPLSPILTALELMRRRDPDAFGRERTLIERQVHHVVRLVDDLLDVSRITRGKVELKRRPIDLADVVAAALETASPIVEARRHHLEVEVPRGVLLVDGDPDRLAQVVSNLLTNAAKYTEPGGLLEVRASLSGRDVALEVSDSGIGISPDLLPRVFDLFVQSERALDRSQGGLGLGLTIVKTLAELHGGRVSAASAGPGRGSTFTLRLPALTPASLTPRPGTIPAVRPRRRAASPRRVLVVDDNQDAADALVEALGAVGHQAVVAYDGPTALDAAARAPPEAAFLDIGLPVMDGYELARRMRELLGAGVKLVAVTGYGQERDRALSRAAGFDEHLVKPVDLERLEGLLEQLLRAAPEGPGAGASA